MLRGWVISWHVYLRPLAFLQCRLRLPSPGLLLLSFPLRRCPRLRSRCVLFRYLLRLSSPPLALSRPFSLSPLCVTLYYRPFLSSQGRAVETPLQAPAFHAYVSGFAALALRGLAHRRCPAFTAGVYGKTIQMHWFHGVFRRCHPLLLSSVSPFELHRTARLVFLYISVFDSLYH